MNHTYLEIVQVTQLEGVYLKWKYMWFSRLATLHRLVDIIAGCAQPLKCFKVVHRFQQMLNCNIIANTTPWIRKKMFLYQPREKSIFLEYLYSNIFRKECYEQNKASTTIFYTFTKIFGLDMFISLTTLAHRLKNFSSSPL